MIDLHAVPGSQNQHWHSDNPTHVAAFWQHPYFQDRVVNLWVALASRYRGNPWVAGYNPVTYLLAGLRSLVTEGWVWGSLGKALLAVSVVGVASMAMCFAALRGRLRRG